MTALQARFITAITSELPEALAFPLWVSANIAYCYDLSASIEARLPVVFAPPEKTDNVPALEKQAALWCEHFEAWYANHHTTAPGYCEVTVQLFTDNTERTPLGQYTADITLTD